ncbi:ComF family protein [Brumimicrobium aurantiacum]|uniref:ComF family protein n=1 Tax=Brumimicrobium aurantiacum TaxID=1737063 RepID=A0A3E1F1E0_9FLAO|nr:phosphoribosyltransferase family protein [Brumimicrobium aurantiacum]RFC55634.1 ComF family protein [Brumimicrobium aurantiacum]
MKSHLLQLFNEYSDGLRTLVFPRYCIICEDELNRNREHFCVQCEANLHYTYFEKYSDYTFADQVFWGRLKIEHVFALLYYEKATSTREILHHIKYNEGIDLANYMGKMMGERLIQSDRFSTIDVIVPIPVHSKKEFSRGYNQSQIIAEGLSETIDCHVVEALYRKSHDESQTRKSKDERFKNVKDKFALRPNALDDYQHVLIVDDVLTTGSTLEFASRAIYEGGFQGKVSLSTIAVAH